MTTEPTETIEATTGSPTSTVTSAEIPDFLHLIEEKLGELHVAVLEMRDRTLPVRAETVTKEAGDSPGMPSETAHGGRLADILTRLNEDRAAIVQLTTELRC